MYQEGGACILGGVCCLRLAMPFSAGDLQGTNILKRLPVAVQEALHQEHVQSLFQ